MDKDHPRRRGRLLTQNCCSKESAAVTVLGRDSGQAEEGLHGELGRGSGAPVGAGGLGKMRGLAGSGASHVTAWVHN